MAPLIPSAKVTLSYPLYACDFDPSDATKFVVGGGGGPGNNGVGNKITVLDVSDPDNLEEIAELDLGKKDDNPTCLAVGKTVSGFTFIYAGVNSSPKDVEKGKNEHFRVYALGKKQQKGKPTIQEVSRDKMFSSRDKAAYQRVLRLSRPGADGIQLGAVATGFADPPELAIFDTADGETSTGSRGVIELEKEAEDVDVIQTGPDAYSVAYCDKQRVYVKAVSAEAESEDALCVYDMPDSGTPGKPYLPTFRALRFLTPEFLAVLINHPARGGALIRILRLVPTPSGPQARPSQTLSLPSQVTQATGFALANLSPPETPGGKQGNTQFALAVADQTAVSLVAMDYRILAGNAIVTQPRLLTRVQNVHALPITGLAFAPFSAPPLSTKTPAPQVLRLGTVSVGNTAVVQSVPLRKPKAGDAAGQHYSVALKPVSAREFTPRNLISVLALLAFAALAQMIMELNGLTPVLLGAKEKLPDLLRNYFTIVEPPARDWHAPRDDFDKHPLASMIGALRERAGEGQPIVVRPSAPGAEDEPERLATFNKGDEAAAQEGMSADIKAKRVRAELHDEEARGPHGGARWEELSEAQRGEWVGRLREMGEWAGELPEALFRGVVFGEMGGVVGRGVGEL